jgi:UDP-3-O-[3-hydroxymyristoyl] glucosamine N-acyltransferase
MFNLHKKKISVKKISKFLNYEYTGKSFNIFSPSSLNNIKNNSILFYTDTINYKFNLKDNVDYDLAKLSNFKNIIVIVPKNMKKNLTVPTILSENPRLDFQRVILKFFSTPKFKSNIHKTAVIEKNTIIGSDVYIGSNCFIGNGVKIGDRTKILSNTVIYGDTVIGSDCVISSNTTIGSEGFGFSFTGEDFTHFAHLGSIIICNDVWIGSNCTIERSQLDETFIGDHVKIDDLVHIAHNSIIGKFSQITGGTVISGRAKIGEGCWISPNSTIDNGCEIGNNCIVGIACLVRQNFPNNSVIVGNPGKILRKNSKANHNKT